MTYLELCQEVRSEAGLTGSWPAAVTGQTGMDAKIVRWVTRAWTEIQNLRDWKFRYAEAAMPVAIGARTLSPSAQGISNLLTIKNDTFRAYWVDGSISKLPCIDWRTFRDAYPLPLNQQPLAISEDPAGQLVLSHVPVQAFTLHFDYKTAPQRLANNLDTPTGLPESLHPVIVHKALMLYGAHDGASDVFQQANNEYQTYLTTMTRLFLDQPFFAARPLA